MQLPSFAYTALCTLLLFGPNASLAAKKNPKDAILLSNVKSLTLRADKKTSHRRVPAVPQLSCVGPGCKHHKVDIMRCTNAGADYDEENIQWSCTASLPEEFKLGGTDVICEGYDSSEDERVLKGSCGVEYRLLLTDLGEEKYGTTWWGGSKSKTPTANQDIPGSGFESGEYLSRAAFIVLFAAVACWILYSLYHSLTNPTRPRQPRQPRAGPRPGFGGGGGGGWGDDDDPPPPYDSYPGKPSSSRRSGQEGWRPGFWSGTAAGAAAAYAAGRATRTQARPVQQNSGWFGGGGGGGSSRPSGSGSGGASSSSGARHESTGFGSTSRR